MALELEELLSGFALGLSLIVAIGAQNAFVIRQGILREHVFFVCLTCAVSDAVLIGAGVLGAAYLVQEFDYLAGHLSLFGGLFLLLYSVTHVWSAYSGSRSLKADSGKRLSLANALLLCLAFTWLNPHVYLETVFLIGTVSVEYSRPWLFGIGAALASFMFFFSIGYFSRFFSKFFTKPWAWRMFDLSAAAIMAYIGGKLIMPWYGTLGV